MARSIASASVSSSTSSSCSRAQPRATSTACSSASAPGGSPRRDASIRGRLLQQQLVARGSISPTTTASPDLDRAAAGRRAGPVGSTGAGPPRAPPRSSGRSRRCGAAPAARRSPARARRAPDVDLAGVHLRRAGLEREPRLAEPPQRLDDQRRSCRRPARRRAAPSAGGASRARRDRVRPRRRGEPTRSPAGGRRRSRPGRDRGRSRCRRSRSCHCSSAGASAARVPTSVAPRSARRRAAAGRGRERRGARRRQALAVRHARVEEAGDARGRAGFRSSPPRPPRARPG